ncbi:Aspartic proteinase CDR1 [Platanthera zijinensis]|uniref:Aspartic proteinase CDR1 n=1 Tax=Platanthera zijinensis TaxID=2320716 RepID=A0AAP0G997_9ASPA
MATRNSTRPATVGGVDETQKSMASSISSFWATFLILSSAGFLPLLVFGRGGFSVDLIHRDSPKSPHYDPSSTPFSRLKDAAERSRARAIYFRDAIQKTSSISSALSSTDNIYSKIIPDSFEYLMSLYLGSPVEEFLAIADTGSDLIWVQCKPCEECYPQKAPLFDPHASSTYKVISCNTDSCSSLPQTSCGEESQCEYKYGYGDGSLVDGFLSSETLSFDSTGGRRIQVPSTLFGCTHRSNGTFSKNGAGLVGLGGGKLSLIRQLGSAIESKFSYCLPSSSQASATSRLNFGASADVSGSNAVTTPLITGFPSTFYFLSLEQVSVEGQGAVKVKPGMQISNHTERGNIIIDSGTTLTLVDDETLKSIAAKVARSVKLPQVKDPNNNFNLCFDVSGYGANAQFPDITFQFAGGASVVLLQSNAFVEAAQNVVCMSLVSSAGIGVNIFGNIAQQNFHIGYNLDAMQLTFAPAYCANL